MNISSASTSGISQVGHQRPPRPDPQKLLAPAAELLSMSVDELQAAKQSGTSLESIAADRGISRDDLLDALKEGIIAAKPEGAPSIEGTARLDRLAESIAAGSGPGRGDRPPPPPPPASSTETNGQLDALASLLDMSTEDLVESLLDGTSLNELAEENNASFSAIVSELERGLVFDSRG